MIRRKSEVKEAEEKREKETGWKKETDNEKEEMCELQEGDGENRVEIRGGGKKQTSYSGNTLHVC